MTALFSFVVLLAVYLFFVVLWNRHFPGSSSTFSNNSAQNHLPPAPLRLVTWNLGYSGLGKYSDFVMEGGRQLLPSSKKYVEDNLNGILSTLSFINADILLLQEVTEQSVVNYNVKMKHSLLEMFDRYSHFYFADVVLRGLPFNMTHGSLLLSRFAFESAHILPLSSEPTYIGGTISRQYAAQKLYLNLHLGADKCAKLVIYNVHLAAYDKEAEARTKQLLEVLSDAIREYTRGNCVVIGGDWNMTLRDFDAPHSTPDQDLFWVHQFPEKALPLGWKLVAGENAPTARSLSEPFTAGRNFVTILDGFVLSPNVRAISVETLDDGFRFSDHQPVVITLIMGADGTN